MFKFAVLIFKNLGRNKLRTTLTALAIVVLVAIYCFVSAVTDAAKEMMTAHTGDTRLLVQEKWTAPSRLPLRYAAKIAAIDGVVDWTHWSGYAGTTDNEGHLFAGFATRVDNLRSMHAGLENLAPAVLDALKAEKSAALVGPQVAQQLGRKVGQTFTLTSITHVGKNLEFKIVGLLPGGLWQRMFFFRRDYYEEATGDRDLVNAIWLKVRDPETGKRVAATVEQMFANSPTQVKVETESAGIARFAGHVQTVVNIIDFVAKVLLVNMVIAHANSITITVRERRKEMAILKVLGFQPGFIVALIVLEAMLVGAVSGLLGAALAFGISELSASGYFRSVFSFLTEFPVPATFVLRGLVIGAAVGFAASAIPAWNVRKVHVVDVFVRA